MKTTVLRVSEYMGIFGKIVDQFRIQFSFATDFAGPKFRSAVDEQNGYSVSLMRLMN